MSETTQFPPVYPPPQQMPRRPRRWPWITGIAVAFVVGIAVGSAGATNRNPALSAATATTAKAPAAATPLPTTTVAPPVTTTVIPTPTPVASAPTHRAATRTQAAPAAPVAPPAAPAPPAPTVLYSKTGTGIGSTPDFTTGAEWQVQYTFDCAGFGQQGNFAVTDDTGDVLVNALAANGSDVAYVHASPGTHSLDINSECDWTVKVIG